jgi:23S rRNA pseudouridine2605 synthase
MRDATTRPSRFRGLLQGMDDALPHERVQRYLARAGVASRRKAEELIAAGRVQVDGVVVALGARVTPGAVVRVDGAPIAARGAHRTFLLHKPAGVIATAADERGRPTVMSLLPAVPGLHPVGRLDRDSEGLLLLTTDGDLTLSLTHPRHGSVKTYRVWCEGGVVDRETCRMLEQGVALDDGPARALRARPAPGGAVIDLGEGRKRQLRRMLQALGKPVQRLLRTHVGALALGDLPPGAYRELLPGDLARAYTRPSSAGRPDVAALRRAEES